MNSISKDLKQNSNKKKSGFLKYSTINNIEIKEMFSTHVFYYNRNVYVYNNNLFNVHVQSNLKVDLPNALCSDFINHKQKPNK